MRRPLRPFAHKLTNRLLKNQPRAWACVHALFCSGLADPKAGFLVQIFRWRSVKITNGSAPDVQCIMVECSADIVINYKQNGYSDLYGVNLACEILVPVCTP